MRKTILTLLIFLFPLTCYAAAQTHYVTPAGAGTKAGGDWDNAMGLAEWDADAEDSAEAGDFYYVAGGTYTLTENFDTARSGNSTLKIHVIGVKSGTTHEGAAIVASDYAYGDDRPLIAATSWKFSWESQMTFKNLRITTTCPTGFETNSYIVLINCKSTQTGANATDAAFTLQATIDMANCEAISTNGRGITISSSRMISSCYILDSVVGIYGSVKTDLHIVNNIIDTCSTYGMDINTWTASRFIGNTIYNCGVGIKAAALQNNIFLNNIIDNCTTGFSATAAYQSVIFDYNVWNNTTDITNGTKGVHAITADPGMTAPADGDFTISGASNCLNAALHLDTNVGLADDYTFNIGADQNDYDSGGSGGSYTFVQ